MQTTPLLLPAPVERRCHLCELILVGTTYRRQGFRVVGATGRAFCGICLETELPSSLQLSDLEEQFSTLDRCVHDLMEIIEAARHRPLAGMRDRVAAVAEDAELAAEALAACAVKRCAVCGCHQDDEGDWHSYLHGEAQTTPHRTRVWLADDLCSACLGTYTPDNTLAGQCDHCEEYSSRLTLHGSGQRAACPACYRVWPMKKEAQ